MKSLVWLNQQQMDFIDWRHLVVKASMLELDPEPEASPLSLNVGEPTVPFITHSPLSLCGA